MKRGVRGNKHISDMTTERLVLLHVSVLTLQLPELSHFLWFIVGILNNILIKGKSFVCYASRTQN
jgi:hypothetical protein